MPMKILLCLLRCEWSAVSVYAGGVISERNMCAKKDLCLRWTSWIICPKNTSPNISWKFFSKLVLYSNTIVLEKIIAWTFWLHFVPGDFSFYAEKFGRWWRYAPHASSVRKFLIFICSWSSRQTATGWTARFAEHPLGAAWCTHFLRYQGLAVANYSGAPECLANERIRRVKNPGWRAGYLVIAGRDVVAKCFKKWLTYWKLLAL